MTMPRRVTVAVIGGGPAGSSAAVALSRAGVDTLIVDHQRAHVTRPGEALSPATARALADLGRSDLNAGRHLQAFGIRSCWASSALVEHDFIFSPPGHGWHLDRQRFDGDGLDWARSSGVCVVATDRPAAIQWHADGATVSVRTAGGEARARAEYLIDATGRRARVAASRGVRRVKYDGLVAATQSLAPIAAASPDQDATLTIEAAPDGWWYTCRLLSGRRMLTYLTDGDLLPPGAKRRSADVTARLAETQHIRRVCDGTVWQADEPIRFCDAGSSRLDRFAGDGWIAAGDAAIAFDPLSSIGVLSASVGGQRAADAVRQWLGGHEAALADYTDWCERVWERYTRELAEQYSHQDKWTDGPFWARRRAAAKIGKSVTW